LSRPMGPEPWAQAHGPRPEGPCPWAHGPGPMGPGPHPGPRAHAHGPRKNTFLVARNVFLVTRHTFLVIENAVLVARNTFSCHKIHVSCHEMHFVPQETYLPTHLTINAFPVARKVVCHKCMPCHGKCTSFQKNCNSCNKKPFFCYGKLIVLPWGMHFPW
jgi:hypothetical protein